jgi:imidazolonepropionase-like amidohydrolase
VTTRALLDAQHKKGSELTKLLHDGGVPLLAGSDTGASNGHKYPGFSLHDELARMVEAGLSPSQALQTATWNAAKWQGRLESLGSIERGKLADLVLLDANPLDDIRNTKKIRAVVANGTWLDRARLDAMMAAAKLKAQH